MSVALVLVGIFSAVCLLVWFLQTAKLRRQINEIPGPPSLPILGNAHQMTSGPEQKRIRLDRKAFGFQVCARMDLKDSGTDVLNKSVSEWYTQVLGWGETFRQYGIFKLWLAKPVVGLTKAETVEVIMNSSRHIDKAWEYTFLHPWLGTGLLTSTGEKWHRRRKMLTPTFHFRILHDFMEVFNKQTQVLIGKLHQRVDQGPFNVFQDIALCALDIICETAMGEDVSAQTADSEYVYSVYKMTSLTEKRMRSPWFWNKTIYNLFGSGHEVDRHLKILHDFTVKVIKDRRNNFDPKQAQRMLSEATDDTFVKPSKVRLAFLDMLLYMADNGSNLTIDDIREEVDTFMFEGHDTTAAGMNWCTYLVGSDDKVQKKVHEELDRVFGTSNRMPTMDDLKELKYLECCIKEALRLYPSVPFFGRTTTEEAKIGPYTIPEGITTIIFTSCIHRDEHWFPDPEVFDPDRFLPENSTGRHPYAYIPFSAGLRNCIGQKFALLEEKVILSSIFRHFRVKTCQTREELLPVGELILRPQKGIIIELAAR